MSTISLRFLVFFMGLCGFLQPNTGHAGGDLSFKSGLGVAVQSDGNYSPMADVDAGYKNWSFNVNLSGYSESKTKVVHILAGVLRSVPLTSKGALEAEFGLGGLIAQTSAAQKNERMVTYTFPIGLNWTIADFSGFVIDANWKSWIFTTHAFLPFYGLLSHDRFTTLALSAGVSL